MELNQDLEELEDFEKIYKAKISNLEKRLKNGISPKIYKQYKQYEELSQAVLPMIPPHKSRTTNSPKIAAKSTQTYTAYTANYDIIKTKRRGNGLRSPSAYRAGQPGTGDLQQILEARKTKKTVPPPQTSTRSFLFSFFQKL